MFTLVDEDGAEQVFADLLVARQAVQAEAVRLGSTKIVERIGADGRQQFIVRVGRLGTLASLVASPVWYLAGDFMVTKLVIRVLDLAGTLLGWVAIQAEARGDGKLWATHPVAIAIERAGQPALLSVHWCDVNVESRVSVETPEPVEVGQTIVALPAGPVLTVGPPATGLPPVTERRNVTIAVPTGRIEVPGLRPN